jgi:hypothetical protein
MSREKSAAVLRGKREAFDTTAIEDIRRMNKGLSSDLVFRIVVPGISFLLRIMTRRTTGMTRYLLSPERVRRLQRLAPISQSI